ncbi:MAG: NAD(P)/FAD-dependent oxidoreductase, partial [Candidatus Binatia bacterium]
MDRTIAIVGAGLAGATAALTLRSEGFDGRIVLVGDEPQRPYSRPPLSKAIVRGEMPPEKSALRPAAIYEKKAIELVLGIAVSEIDLAGRALVLADGRRIVWHRLLLATGGRPRRLGGAHADDGVHVLRTMDDAIAIRDRIGPGRSLLVVGGGFIGAELAASARMRGTDVTILEALRLPLCHVLPPRLGAIYAEIHRSRGVDLRTGVTMDRIEHDRVVASDGRSYAADTIAVAIGIV